MISKLSSLLANLVSQAILIPATFLTFLANSQEGTTNVRIAVSILLALFSNFFPGFNFKKEESKKNPSGKTTKLHWSSHFRIKGINWRISRQRCSIYRTGLKSQMLIPVCFSFRAPMKPFRLNWFNEMLHIYLCVYLFKFDQPGVLHLTYKSNGGNGEASCEMEKLNELRKLFIVIVLGDISNFLFETR